MYGKLTYLSVYLKTSLVHILPVVTLIMFESSIVNNTCENFIAPQYN